MTVKNIKQKWPILTIRVVMTNTYHRISHGATIDRLAEALRGSTHRTNHGEFLWRSSWDESIVMRQIALDKVL